MCEHLCDPDIFLDIGSEKFNKVNNFHLFWTFPFESTEEIEAGILRSNKCYQGQYRNHGTVMHCLYSFFFPQELKIILKTSFVQRLNVTKKSHKILCLLYHKVQVTLYWEKLTSCYSFINIVNKLLCFDYDVNYQLYYI